MLKIRIFLHMHSTSCSGNETLTCVGVFLFNSQNLIGLYEMNIWLEVIYDPK